MNLEQKFDAWKPAVGVVIGDGQCVALVINNSGAYAEALFPGVSWTTLVAPVTGAKDLLGAFNPAYFDVVYNDHSNPNQLPPVGAIMVFDKTPAVNPATGKPTTNQYNNPYGHDGINAGADANGFDLAQQNAPSSGQGFNVAHYDWNFRLCLGWAIPKVGNDVPPQLPTPPAATGQRVTLPASVATWAAYRVGSSLVKGSSAQVGTLLPAQFGGLTYDILGWVGDYAVNIRTDAFGVVTIWVKDTDAVIN